MSLKWGCFGGGGKYYFDKTLAMGCRTSAKIFERFSSALEWILKHKGGLKVIHHILDDFLLMTKPAQLAPAQRGIFTSITSVYLGIPLKIPKSDFGFELEFVGVDLDTVRMQARLPQDKVRKCTEAINEILIKGFVFQEDLASLIGMLNFACRVVRPGRAFLRRMYDFLYSVPKPTSRIHMNALLSADLHMWLEFLFSYNGVTVIHEDRWVTSQTIHTYTDASKTHGYGLVYGSKWAYGEFPPAWKKEDIFCLEAYPVMLVFNIFCKQLANKKLVIHTDNSALVTTLNKQTCRDPLTMVFVRDLVLVALRHNIVFYALHIEGKLNTLADRLSRLQVDKFWEMAKERGRYMEPEPLQIPCHLLPGNYALT